MYRVCRSIVSICVYTVWLIFYFHLLFVCLSHSLSLLHSDTHTVSLCKRRIGFYLLSEEILFCLFLFSVTVAIFGASLRSLFFSLSINRCVWVYFIWRKKKCIPFWYLPFPNMYLNTFHLMCFLSMMWFHGDSDHRNSSSIFNEFI